MNKEEQWISLFRAMIDAGQVATLIGEMENENYEVGSSLDAKSALDDLFLFSQSIFREHLCVLLSKTVNPGKSTSMTLFSFMKAYSAQSMQQKEFGKWKKQTKETREHIRNARNAFAAHIDGDVLNKNFGLTEDDVDSLIDETLRFLDILYENDDALKKSFNDEIIKSGHPKLPSEISNSSRRNLIARIRLLKEYVV